MAHYPLSAEHSCKPDNQAVCWHVRGTLPDGRAVAYYARSDSSNGPIVSITMEHPEIRILSIVFGRFDEQLPEQNA
jgi:hypothetical protein